jgi:hypothetical protein
MNVIETGRLKLEMSRRDRQGKVFCAEPSTSSPIPHKGYSWEDISSFEANDTAAMHKVQSNPEKCY